MGGGDLNLKKSWHPSTMRNMEKVWKAEQRENEERKRIAELQREIIAERSREDMQRFAEDSGVVEKKDTTKLDWMYKGPSGIVDREEYLLGRAVDKSFEHQQQSEQPGKAVSSRKNAVERGDECLPNSIRFATDQQVDLARKMQEDPLLAIKKKEAESRQQLLSNPVKLKQLKQLVEMQSKGKKQKKEKKAKKDKKKSKKKKSSKSKNSDSDSSETGDESKLDAILAKKLNSLKNAGLLRSLNDHIDDLDAKTKKSRQSKELDGVDSDLEEDYKAKNASSKHQRTESGNRPKDQTKREWHGSREEYDSRKRMSKMESSESKRYSDKHREEPGRRRQNESYERRGTSSQKSRINYDSEEEPSRKKSKYENGRERVSDSKKSRRSGSRSPDRRQRYNQDRFDRNKEEKRRGPAPDDRVKESRTRRDCDSNDDSEMKSRRKEKANEKPKKTRKRESSSDRDSTSSSSSSSSSEDESDKKCRIFIKKERNSDDEEGRPALPKFGLMLPDGSRPVPKCAPPVKEEKKSERSPEKPKWTKPERKKMDEKELEARRREMLENSSWREKERERNIKRHREELEAESRHQTKYDEHFARKQLAHAVSHSTVEGRIKSNINNIQRSKMAMDKNFARR